MSGHHCRSPPLQVECIYNPRDMPFLADAGTQEIVHAGPLPEIGVARVVRCNSALRADWRSRSENLVQACAMGDESAVARALRAGAAPNAKDSVHTCLGHAALAGFERIVHLLLSASADPDAINAGGETAAEAALRSGNIMLAEELQHRQQHVLARAKASEPPKEGTGAATSVKRAATPTANAARLSSDESASPKTRPPAPSPSIATRIPTASTEPAVPTMDDAALDQWVQSETHAFLKHGDEERMRHVLREDAKARRSRAAAVMRSYARPEPEGEQAAGDGATLVIAFGGLQQRLGGGAGGGVPPYEFVRSCQKAGARHSLFVRDATRSWYCRGLGIGSVEERTRGGDGDGGGGGGVAWRETSTFDAMVEELRAEIAALAPSRVVTIGSSMGGYAAVRAGIALNAHTVIAFSPQVLIEPSARKAAGLDPMHFDDLLSWLFVVSDTRIGLAARARCGSLER